MAWSGDIFQQNQSTGNNDLQFVVPAEGGTIWTDNMMIPKLAQNPVSAMKLIDWFYQPEIATMLTENIKYISRSPRSTTLIKQDASARRAPTARTRRRCRPLADSPLVFPPASVLSRTAATTSRRSDPKTAQTFNEHLQRDHRGLIDARDSRSKLTPYLPDAARRPVARGVLRGADHRDDRRCPP